MELTPIGPGFAAEVHGANLIDVASSDATYRQVRAAFEAHSVLLFRKQEIADDIQAAFSRAFGPLERVKVGSPGAGTFYSRLHNLAADGSVVPVDHRQALDARANQLWHTDSSFKPTPALASVLSARIVPDRGGQTEFVSTRLAWARLGSPLRESLYEAVVSHAYAHSRSQIDPNMMSAEEHAALPAVRWRISWRNPVNDQRALYVASHAFAISGMTDVDARVLLARLISDATQPEFVFQHRWQPGDVLMWDNRATMHRGRPWPDGLARSMVRTTVQAVEADGLAELRPGPAPSPGKAPGASFF